MCLFASIRIDCIIFTILEIFISLIKLQSIILTNLV